MKAFSIAAIAIVLTTVPSRAQWEREGDLVAAYGDLTTRKGHAYLKLRDEILKGDKQTIKAFLSTRREEASEDVQRLWVDALLLRLDSASRIDTALADAFRTASVDRSRIKRNPNALPDAPRPSEAGDFLVTQLGSDALPFATEILTRDLARDWTEWKRTVPLWTLAAFGRQVRAKGTSGEIEFTDIRDKRAGMVLLFVAEHSEDPAIAGVAAYMLRKFATPALLQHIESARDRTTSDQVRERFAKAAKAVSSEIRTLGTLSSRPASQPS